mgnify:CR=1 FL=1
MTNQRNILIAKQYGIKNAELVAEAATIAKIPFSVACALVSKESYGGENLWGNDEGGVFAELPREMTVTKGAFEVFEYKVVTLKETSNGVGPTQITWRGFFPDAREKGLKLWKPLDNMIYGFGLLHLYRYEQQLTWEEAGTRYNGAKSYGEDFVEQNALWRKRFRS